jgi:hypothetical protein
MPDEKPVQSVELSQKYMAWNIKSIDESLKKIDASLKSLEESARKIVEIFKGTKCPTTMPQQQTQAHEELPF